MAYISMRRYEGVTHLDEVVRRAEDGFVPIISGTPGFIAYHIVDAGNGVAVSISVFESQAGADESTQRAASWVKENLAQFIPNPPQVTAGEARVSHQK
jgi:hypothetical protein